MGILLFTIWILLIIKAILFWVYLWQIKEYRWDRFMAEYASFKKLLKFWLGSGGRRILIPRFTLKSVSIILFSLAFAVYGWLAMPLAAIGNYFLFLILSYLSIFPLVSFVVYLLNIPTKFAKNVIFYLAKRKMANFKNIIVIGITGSYGKSSTKEFLYQILKEKFKVKKTPANINTEIGIAKFVLFEIKGDEDIFIAEMGAYKVGEIKKNVRYCKAKNRNFNRYKLSAFSSFWFF